MYVCNPFVSHSFYKRRLLINYQCQFSFSIQSPPLCLCLCVRLTSSTLPTPLLCDQRCQRGRNLGIWSCRGAVTMATQTPTHPPQLIAGDLCPTHFLLVFSSSPFLSVTDPALIWNKKRHSVTLRWNEILWRFTLGSQLSNTNKIFNIKVFGESSQGSGA